MRTLLALLAVGTLAACSPSERAPELEGVPEVVSEEALSAWTIHVADPTGGASAFQMAVEDGNLAINTISDGFAWRPADLILRGDFEVSAVFEPRDPGGERYVYGIVVGGKNLPDPDRSYTFFLVKPNSEHQIGRVERGKAVTLVDWRGVEPAIADVEPTADAGQRLSVRVIGEHVHFMLHQRVVATLKRDLVHPYGIAGIQVGADAGLAVRHWNVTHEEAAAEPR